tara:strand:- start:1206 stop:2900 length:1695 start_codon:yes stop_codon:yes gene_type:complete
MAYKLSNDIIKKSKNFSLIIFPILIWSLVTSSIEVKTILVIIISIIYMKYDFDLSNFKFKSFKLPFSILFIVIIITQNQFLNYEMISLDTPSYLVASQKVGFNELPFQNQWESKGPLFLYMYNFISFLSSENLVLFKILNDFILFFLALVLFLTIYKKNESIQSAFMGSLLFICLVSYIWYHSEFSEIYCLMFISLHFYFIKNKQMNLKNIFLASLLLSGSTLINQATLIFYLSFFLFLVFRKKVFLKFKELLSLSLGMLIPHMFLIIIYFNNGLLNIYLSNYFVLPINYVGSDRFEFNELLVWLKRYFEYNEFLYFILIFLIISFLFHIFVSKTKIYKSYEFMDVSLYLIPGFLIYVIAGHSYEHHLFYAIYFLAILSEELVNNKNLSMGGILIILCSIQIVFFSFSSSFNNLSNIDKIHDHYPLYQLSQEIDSYFDDDNYSVLAFDHVLVLHYLQKQNFSYLVHPSNNFEGYILDELISLNLLPTNEASHFSYYIEKEPDVIICNSKQIISGDVVKLDDYNCEVSDYKKNYFKLDTSVYEKNRNREYFFDPYKELRVYIKNS